MGGGDFRTSKERKRDTHRHKEEEEEQRLGEGAEAESTCVPVTRVGCCSRPKTETGRGEGWERWERGERERGGGARCSSRRAPPLKPLLSDTSGQRGRGREGGEGWRGSGGLLDYRLGNATGHAYVRGPQWILATTASTPSLPLLLRCVRVSFRSLALFQ